MLSKPIIVERSAQPYLAIRLRVAMRDISKIAGSVLPELFAWLQQHGIAASGAPFFKYNVIDTTDQLEIEVGVPIATEITGDSRVVSGILPAGRYASVTYRGSYDRLVEANSALLQWIAENRLQADVNAISGGDRFSCRLEIYHSDPTKESNPEKWETEVAIRLATGSG